MMSEMELKPGYKQTEVGVIPEDWDVKKFEDVTRVITCGVASTPKYVNENQGYPFLSSTNIKAGKIIWNNFNFISSDLHNQLYKNNPPKFGDILYSRVGSIIGEAAIVDVGFEFSIYVSLTLIKPKDLLDSLFLKHLLNSPPYKNMAYKQVFLGSGVQNLNVEIVRKYPIIIPPLFEQTAIATALSDVDALISGLDRLIEKKRAIKQAAMQELLTGKRRLPGFDSGKGYKQTEVGEIPEDWNTRTINEICENNCLVRGPFGGSLKKEIFVTDGFKVYEQKNAIQRDSNIGSYFVNEETFKKLKRFEVKEGDFIVSCSGTIGKIFLIPKGSKPGIINQALLKIKTNDQIVNKDFFYYLFEWDKFQEKVIDKQGGAMPNLVGMDTIRNIQIPAPTLPEQTAIATVLSDMDAEISALETRRAKTISLKQGMIQELLTGRIRLV